MAEDSLHLHLFPEWFFNVVLHWSGKDSGWSFARKCFLVRHIQDEQKTVIKLTWLMATLHIDDHSKNAAHLLLIKSSYNTLKKLSP